MGCGINPDVVQPSCKYVSHNDTQSHEIIALRVIDLFTFDAHIHDIETQSRDFVFYECEQHMTRKTKNASFPIVLKTIINDAHRDNKTFTLNDKQIRSRLRARINAHVRNTSWIANNQREYDAIRCAFDASYATRIANTSKRASRKNAKTNATNDANENA